MSGSKRKGSADKGDEGEGKYTTFRFYAVDGDDLRQLAALETEEFGDTIAEVYRRVAAPAVRDALRKALTRGLKRLQEPPQG